MFYGGPDLTPQSNQDKLQGQTFILIGRKGLCKNNGIFQKHNIESVEMFIQDNLNENSKFFYAGFPILKYLQLKSLFSAPTLVDVNPKLDFYEQGQMMEIIGINFGNFTEYLQEVEIDKVIYFLLVFPIFF